MSDDDLSPGTQGHMAADPAIDWESVYSDGGPETPVDTDLMALAGTLTPGRALDLGCGAGQNSIWLASQGWDVLGVDLAKGAIELAERAAARADARVRFECGDLTTWNTSERFDLVISTYALPPAGPGRIHALTVARDAVAPHGVASLAEFEVSLAESGWMAREHLVTLDEIVEMFPGFELERAEVMVSRHGHDGETRELPIVFVVARHPGPLGADT